jgi:sodium/proline symporter
MIVLYFLVIFGIGFWTTRKTKTQTDYLVAGKGLGTVVLSFAIMAAIQSGWTWLGLPGSMYKAGYAPMIGIMSFGAFLGLAVCYYALAVPMRRLADSHGAMTVADTAYAIYESNALRIIVAATVFIGATVYLVAQWSALGHLLSTILKISYPTAVLISFLITAFYVVGGGMLASAYNHFFQMSLMLIGSVVVFIATLHSGGGLSNINQVVGSADPNMLNYHNAAAGFSIGFMWLWFFMYWFSTIGQPQISVRFYSVKSIQRLKWSLLIAGLSYIIGCLCAYTGLQVKALVTQGVIPPLTHPDTALPVFVAYYFSPIAQGLIYVAVLAATMSTADSFIIVSSSAVVRDIWHKGLGKNLSEKGELLGTRVLSVIVAVISVLLSLNPPQLISLIGATAWGGFGATIGPLLLLGLRWKRATTAGAIASSCVGLFFGFGLFLAHKLKLTTWLIQYPEGGVAIVASMATMIIVSLLTAPQEKKIFSNFKFGRKDTSTSAA